MRLRTAITLFLYVVATCYTNYFVQHALSKTHWLEATRSAEARLLSLAHRFGNHDEYTYEIDHVETSMPSSILPLKNHHEELNMHGIKVRSSKKKRERETTTKSTTMPLVLLHGYMNGAVYYYRNLLGLSHSFESVYSLDMMGFGLSSRPNFNLLRDESIETVEDFFVESLEAWRSKNGIEKMILAGHSFGGYMSVAYCEKYPQHVDRLVLLSPVGLPEMNERQFYERLSNLPWRTRLFDTTIKLLWNMGITPGDALRTLPARLGKRRLRFPLTRDWDEYEALRDYLYAITMLPGSGEYALNKILVFGAYAKKPTIHRIPNLKVSHVTFIYGERDWMDIFAGRQVETICHDIRNDQEGGELPPQIEVLQVPNAPHLLMLWYEEFNAAVIKGILER